MHDLDQRRLPRPLRDRGGGADDRAHLHLVDLGELEAQAATACPEHRVRLVQLFDPCPHQVGSRLLGRRKKLVERRVEQPDRHGESRHRLEDPLEVRLLHRQQLLERHPALRFGRGEDHLLHVREAVLRHEHVLGPTQADPLGAELACLRGVLRCVGVGPDAQATRCVGPAENRVEVRVELRRDERHRPEVDLAVAPVDRDRVALGEDVPTDRHRARSQVDRQPLTRGDARLPHAAGDNGRMRGHAAMRGENAT